MSDNGEIYTAGKNFTLPPALTGWTNSTSVHTMTYGFSLLSHIPTESGSHKIYYCARLWVYEKWWGPFLHLLSFISVFTTITLHNPQNNLTSPAAPSCPTWWTNTQRRTPAKEVSHCKAMIKIEMLYLLWCLMNIASINVIMLLI